MDRLLVSNSGEKISPATFFFHLPRGDRWSMSRHLKEGEPGERHRLASKGGIFQLCCVSSEKPVPCFGPPNSVWVSHLFRWVPPPAGSFWGSDLQLLLSGNRFWKETVLYQKQILRPKCYFFPVAFPWALQVLLCHDLTLWHSAPLQKQSQTPHRYKPAE